MCKFAYALNVAQREDVPACDEIKPYGDEVGVEDPQQVHSGQYA